ncbi:hypothetical protein CW749_22105 [Vibrio sp. vnigr-6D03]|uniref:MFS transporter n=1 Tax=Vibrio sp. vnigr-6D03 TaxID=2058088 RepID=UPI000C34E0DF|nr:MFS transporter [Vibrio sp. vnigr-6D03]PKF77398.1 hypothetical protein CW749_22105 [Vibrio sp. vnigr-6D03]
MFKNIDLPGLYKNSSSLFMNKQVLAIFLLASASAAVNPYKNIFGIDVVGVSELSYSLVMLFSGIVITIFSIFFGMRSDINGSFVKYIYVCAFCGIVGNLSLYFWPNEIVYFVANCLLLPVFFVINSLIFGYAAAKRQNVEGNDQHKENAALRSVYSMGYVATLGVIGSLALEKNQLIYVWLYAGIFAALILGVFSNEPLKNVEYKSDKASESLLKVFNNENVIKLISVSLVTNMLFTLDATVPLIIVNQVQGGYSGIGAFEASIAIFEVFFIFYWSRLASKMQPSSVIIIGAVIFAISIALLSFTQTMTHIYLLIPMLALGAACLISIPIGFLQSLATGRAGVGGSLLSISFFISSSVSSVVYFVGMYYFETKGAIWLSSIVGLVGLLVLYFIDRKKHQ